MAWLPSHSRMLKLAGPLRPRATRIAALLLAFVAILLLAGCPAMVDRAFSRTKDNELMQDDLEIEKLLVSSGLADSSSSRSPRFPERAPQKT